MYCLEDYHKLKVKNSDLLEHHNTDYSVRQFINYA